MALHHRFSRLSQSGQGRAVVMQLPFFGLKWGAILSCTLPAKRFYLDLSASISKTFAKISKKKWWVWNDKSKLMLGRVGWHCCRREEDTYCILGEGGWCWKDSKVIKAKSCWISAKLIVYHYGQHMQKTIRSSKLGNWEISEKDADEQRMSPGVPLTNNDLIFNSPICSSSLLESLLRFSSSQMCNYPVLPRYLRPPMDRIIFS